MYSFWSLLGWAHILTVILLFVSSTAAIGRAPDLMGDYCKARSSIKCCEKRSDSCTALIRHPSGNAVCYCDAFCKNTTNNDCCPDYDEVCLKMPLKGPTCEIDGRPYTEGQKFTRNCNNCECKEDGEIFCDLTVCVTDTHLIARIRSMNLGWIPAYHAKFWAKKYADTLYKIAFTVKYNEKIKRYQEHAKRHAKLKPKPQVPKEFDSRYKWPGMISITDQKWCNTAWAHSTVSTINDRLRIQSMEQNIKLSVEDMIDCSHSRQEGCFGSGHLDRARNYLRRRGLRSEHGYRREKEFQCSNSTRSRRYRSGPWYLVWGEANIQKEILDFGPVQATMKIYRDFFSYKEGIYRRSGLDPDEGSRTGFQAVRIIGWGEERGTRYWIVANSWGTDWGEDGYFRIRRGFNECGIEEYVFAAWGPPLKQWKPLSSWPDTTDGANRKQNLYIIAGASGKVPEGRIG